MPNARQCASLVAAFGKQPCLPTHLLRTQIGMVELKSAIARLENVAEARYLGWTLGFPMKAAGRTTKAIIGNATGGRLWRWPLALSLALAVAISLFHDLPAFAGRSDSSPASVTVVSSIPVHAPDSQAPGHGCHCLCHMTAQAVASPAVSPVVFNEPLYLPPQDVPARSCAGLPPFRPPRV